MTDQPALRANARRNRSAIVAAARAAFAEHGMDAALDEIAKRAQVGSGTLYRHFATRDDLIAAVFLERMAENVTAVEQARQNPDAWDGFCDYVRRTCRAQATDKGLADLIAIGHRGNELRKLRAEAYDGFVALIDLGEHPANYCGRRRAGRRGGAVHGEGVALEIRAPALAAT